MNALAGSPLAGQRRDHLAGRERVVAGADADDARPRARRAAAPAQTSAGRRVHAQRDAVARGADAVPGERAHSCAIRRPAHERDEHRRADERGDDADLQLARPHHDAADHVGAEQQDRREHDRVGEHAALVRAGDRARHVRDREADEADRPGDRGRAAAQQRDGERAERARAPDVRAERAARRRRRARARSAAARARARAARRRAGTGRRRRGSPRSRPASAPTDQKRKSSNASGSSSVTPDVNAVSAAATAVPASASRTGVAPARPREPSTYTTTEASAAPANANHTYAAGLARPSTPIATTIAAAAPASTPSSPGSASGLRVSACISAPASPSAIPTARPTSVRGTRSSRTIAACSDPSSCSSPSNDIADRDRLRPDREAENGDRDQGGYSGDDTHELGHPNRGLTPLGLPYDRGLTPPRRVLFRNETLAFRNAMVYAPRTS